VPSYEYRAKLLQPSRSAGANSMRLSAAEFSALLEGLVWKRVPTAGNAGADAAGVIAAQ
jgi:hypothetical protein